MRKTIAALGLLAVTLATPLAARADVDATLIPDGTYTVKVAKVVDATHMIVVMQNSVKTEVTANRPTMDFTKLAPNDSVKMSLGKGKVLVYMKQ